MVETESYISDYVSDFLSFIQDVKETHSMAEATLEEANLELSDLQHYLEFETCSAPVMAKLAREMREVRKKRRKAKNDIELCQQLLLWIDENKRALDALGNTLGQIRKIERKQENRAYSIRTHILDDISSKSHLVTRHDSDDGGMG